MEKQGPIELYEERLRKIERRRFVRPMATNSIFDLATRIYQREARSLLARTAIPGFFCFISALFFIQFIFPSLFMQQAGTVGVNLTDLGIGLLLTAFVAIPLFVYGFASCQAVSTQIVAPIILGEERAAISHEQIARLSWKMMGLLFFLGLTALLPLLVMSLALAAGAVLEQTASGSSQAFLLGAFGVFSIVVAVFFTPFLLYRVTLSPAVIVMEPELSIRAAVKRGILLLKSYRTVPSVGGTVITAWIVMFFVFLGLQTGASLLVNLVASTGPFAEFVSNSIWGQFFAKAFELIPGYLTIWLLMPFWTIVSTLLYIDRRVQIEALDIRLLARDVADAVAHRRGGTIE